MVTIGTGPDDPRAWVRAAYLILDAATASPDDKLPSHVQIAATLGISRFTARRACRELAGMGLVRLVPGYGYFPVGGT
jgi:DNA-binding GntR family transcriptional regulator